MANEYDLNGIKLPGDLLWEDEFKWSKFRQSRTNALTGALIIQQSTVESGRPITLVSQLKGDKVYGPVARSVIEQLRALEDSAPESAVLTHPDGRTFTVAFRMEGEAAVEAEQLLFLSPAQATDWYDLTLRLIEL